MSIHKSLVPPSKLRRHRNVLTRSERLEILKKDGRWTEDQSVFGLVKVRNIMLKAKPKKKEETAEAAAAVPGTAAAAAPAAGAAPAKGAAPAGKGAAAAPAKGAAPAKKEEKKK